MYLKGLNDVHICTLFHCNLTSLPCAAPFLCSPLARHRKHRGMLLQQLLSCDCAAKLMNQRALRHLSQNNARRFSHGIGSKPIRFFMATVAGEYKYLVDAIFVSVLLTQLTVSLIIIEQFIQIMVILMKNVNPPDFPTLFLQVAWQRISQNTRQKRRIVYYRLEYDEISMCQCSWWSMNAKNSWRQKERQRPRFVDIFVDTVSCTWNLRSLSCYP